MNVTSQILIFLFSREYPVLSENTPISDNNISSIRRFDKNDEPDSNTLYVVSYADLKQILNSGKRYEHLFLITPDGKLPSKKDLQKLSRCNYAITTAFYTTYELQNALLKVFHELLRQENELLLATMSPSRTEEVFAFGNKWFPWEYSIVDFDMRLLYRSENLHKLLGGEKVDRIPSESLNELILSREFHDAARKKELFYQTMTFNDLTAVGRNILPDNQYAGRVVLFLSRSLKHMPKGGEELFTFFTDCVMESIRRSGRFVSRKQNDPLHLLCRALFQGENAAAHAVNDVLKRTGWKTGHLYTVITFRFLADSAWEAQLETTLPYLADELESEWPESCAVVSKREVNWVLNLTLSEMDADLNGFHQRIAYFVRDHVCIAGVSPAFHQFVFLEDALKSAEAALEIGQQRHPDFWYFSFDDYRLDYIKEALQNQLPPVFLRHPAVYMLEQYDRENNTELSGTLKSYLEHGRNMSVAADAIYIHRTTFCRRMDHIKKLTGLDLEDLNTLILLELSYQFAEE
ncbi:MAG: helix-turn-helix domain-containing protein [Parasporobacterium sp.]|nr:helix-turn-helix domain-containing protein [Parasporobacterium sp.]